MYKAIGYCRVSKGDKEEIKNSLQSQKTEIIGNFFNELNLKEDEIFLYMEEEAVSAFKENIYRTKFEEAINEACSNHEIKYFLAYNQERFCRNKKKSQIYKEKLRKNGVQVRFVSGDVEDPDSDSGFWQEGIQEMVAEAYSRKVGKDTLRGCKQNATNRDEKTGYAYKNGGAAPFWLKTKKIAIGQDKFGEDIKKSIWVENDTIHTATLNGEIVSKTMWEWAKYYFIELRLKQKLGIEKARDVLNELEIPAPRGQYWTQTGLISAEKNEALIGTGSYNKRKYAGSGGGYFKDKSEWIIVENAHPALLTDAEFEALKKLRKMKLKRDGTLTNYQSNNLHLLTGGEHNSFTCGCCGSKIISSGNVYTCGKYNANGRKGCGASYFSIKTEWLENKILTELLKSLSDSELEKYYAGISEYYSSDEKIKEQIKNTKKAISDDEKAKANLIKSLTSMNDMNEFTLKLLSKELNKVSDRLEKLTKELDKLTKRKTIKPPSFERVKNHLLRAKLLLTQSNSAESKELIWCFVNSITLDPVEREIIASFKKNPFSVLMEKLNNGKNIVEGDFSPSTELVAGAGFEPTTFGL